MIAYDIINLVFSMKNLVFRVLFFFILTSTFYILYSGFAFSQSQANSISVTPSIAHIDLATDAPEYTLTYKNTTKYPIELSLNVQDFTELEEEYRINFLTGKDASNYRYSLSSWVSFENRNLELSPGETKSVRIFIDKDRITIGGHYASILAEVSSPEDNKNVNVKQVLSSLLFVRASTGKEIEDGSVSSFTPLRDAFEYPNVYVLRFENKGNVHVVPYGLLSVIDPLGRQIEKGILNEGSLDALPESIRRYDIEVKNKQNILLPGFYTATLSIHYGKENKKLETSSKFFSYGSFDPVKIVVLMVVLVGAIYLFRRLRTEAKTGDATGGRPVE